MTIVMTQKIPAGVFKAKCLDLLEEVRKSGKELIITKRGKPCARVVPISEKVASVFGAMAGTIRICGDIVSPTGEGWRADA